MFSRCFFCQTPLPANQSLEHFRLGRRVAFDPARGRLWAVCPACARWNLAPIEERWEALEELERLARDRARLLVQTDNIGLLRAGELEIVRVGRAHLREEAWWRYGQEMARRHQRGQQLVWLDIALALTIGMPLLRHLWRGTTFRRGAPAGARRCDRCGASLTAGPMSLRKVSTLVLRPGDGGFSLRLDCRYCATRHHGTAGAGADEQGGTVWTGAEAARILRTGIAYLNFDGGPPAHVDAACLRVASAGSAAGLVREIAGQGLSLYSVGLQTQASLALEIALNDEREHRLLELEAAALEACWREEEGLAAIMDGELTPVPALEPTRRP